GERGELLIAGRRAEELALEDPGHFETVAERLLELGAGESQPGVRERLAEARVAAFSRIPQLTSALSLPDSMDALIAATAQGSSGSDALSVLGALPVYVAAAARLRAGQSPLAPDASSFSAADFLSMLG